MVRADEILTFWFGDPPEPYLQRKKVWFGKDPAFDQTIRDRFLSTYESAAVDELDEWQTTPQGCLALILVLDQFSRNLFRQQPRAFAADPKARMIVKGAMRSSSSSGVKPRLDQQLEPLQRAFFYLPLEHSEDLTDQHQSVALYQALVSDRPELHDLLDYAIRHRNVIEQFGRFPHRNVILNRPSTPEEIQFLKQPGSSF